VNALRLIRFTAWAAVAALAVMTAYIMLAPRDGGGGLGTASIGGPFVLASTQGAPVDSATLKGRPYAMFFGFTQCPDVCPTTMFEVSQNLKTLDDDPELAAKAKALKVYFVTVDPERDDASLLRDYLSAFDHRIVGLIPKDDAELQRVAKEFHVFYEKVKTPSGYTMNHTASVFLFDAAGNWVGALDSQEGDDVRIAKLKRLLERAPAI
jgi:protein SCO1/2